MAQGRSKRRDRQIGEETGADESQLDIGSENGEKGELGRAPSVRLQCLILHIRRRNNTGVEEVTNAESPLVSSVRFLCGIVNALSVIPDPVPLISHNGIALVLLPDPEALAHTGRLSLSAARRIPL